VGPIPQHNRPEESPKFIAAEEFSAVRHFRNSSPPMSFPRYASLSGIAKTLTKAPVVHLELHTDNLPRACAFYTRLFDWHAETVTLPSGSYLSLGLGNGIEGGVVESEPKQALWLPYVQVDDIAATTERARELGASVPLGPREGPVGWRSVLRSPSGAAIALWQPKT
jgi:predicted enzyme related to lactoylglutathione lyase